MNENEFEFSGVAYISAEPTDYCVGCAFIDDTIKCVLSPDCRRSVRADGRDVIFVEKQQ